MPTWHQNHTTQIAMPAATQEIPIIDEKELELQVSYPWVVFINLISFLTGVLAGTLLSYFLSIHNLSWREVLSLKKLFL